MTAFDVEAHLVAWLRGAPGVAAVGVDMPADVEQHLPFVQVTLMPSTSAVQPWNAIGPDRYMVDIDVYAGQDTGRAATDVAVEVASAVRARLRATDPAVLVPAEVPVLVPRPESNPKLRHRGALVEFLGRRT